MKGRLLMAAVFGAVGGPMAYYAGYKLGAVAVPDIAVAMLALGIGWAVMMPLLMFLSDRFNGFELFQQARS
jgi:tetrahydromethanopterin S-methyltransferase subunit D